MSDDSGVARLVAPDARIDHYVVAPDRVDHTEAALGAMRVATAAAALWGLIVLVVVIRTRLAPRVAAWVARRTARAWLQVVVVTVVVLAIVAVAKLPITLVVQPRLYAAVGAPPWAWLAAWPMETVTTIAVATVVAAIGYALVRRFGSSWWWRAWLVTIPLLVAGPSVGVYLQERAARPLAEVAPALADRIVQLAAGRDLALDREHVFVVPSTSPDAHADGVGPWRAVFVNEGALANLNDRELWFLAAHEVGHLYPTYVGAAAIGVVVLAAGAALFGFARLLAWLVRRFGARYGVPAVEHPAALPFALLALAVFGLATGPLRAFVQTRIEHAADANGMRLLSGRIDDPGQAAAHELQRVGEVLALPARGSVLDALVGVDHPAIGDRIDFVLDAARR